MIDPDEGYPQIEESTRVSAVFRHSMDRTGKETVAGDPTPGDIVQEPGAVADRHRHLFFGGENGPGVQRRSQLRHMPQVDHEHR